MEKVNDLIKKTVSRRTFMAGAGTAAAAALLAGCNDATAPPSPPASGGGGTNPPLAIPDNDILNFALNLEYLEAEFYLRAATGNGLSSADALSGAGTVTGGAAVPGFSTAMQQYAVEIAQDELNHVRAIQSTITGNKGTPVARPNIDFTNAFNALAAAAGIGPSFNPFSSPSAFLVGAFVFEDVGVTAYTGAAPAITNANILSAAAGIQAVEAYHAAEIRTLLVGMAAANSDQTYVDYANKVSTLRSKLGGGKETMLSVNTIVAADNNAIAFARSTDEVLHIVYAAAPGAGVKSGGFFPNGLNGSISTTAS